MPGHTSGGRRGGAAAASGGGRRARRPAGDPEPDRRGSRPQDELVAGHLGVGAFGSHKIIEFGQQDAELIVAMRNALPALLDVADAARHTRDWTPFDAWSGWMDVLDAALARLDSLTEEKP